jgi:hypothetical protein
MLVDTNHQVKINVIQVTVQAVTHTVIAKVTIAADAV